MKIFKWCLALISVLQCHLVLADPIGTFVPLASVSADTPISVAYSPIYNDRLFVAIVAASKGANYQVDRVTGLWTEAPNSPINQPNSETVAYSPVVNGKLFAAILSSGSPGFFSTYTVDDSGNFALAGSANTGTNPIGITFSPLTPEGNLFAAVANGGSNTVGVYSVNTSTGALGLIDSYPTGNYPHSVAYSPLFDGQLFLITANSINDNLSFYTVNTSTGELTEVAGSPFSTAAGPNTVAFSPIINGNLFAAVANDSSVVSAYTVTSAGLQEVTDSPFSTGNPPTSLAYSPIVNSALFTAVTKFTDKVSVYSVNPSSGTLTPLSNSPFTAGDFPSSVAYSPFFGGHLFAAVTNASASNISLYSVIIPPSVSQLTPNQGSSLGGTSVIITGNGFDDVTEVFFGTTSASFTRDSSAQITAIAPPGVGTVDVTVVTANGISPVSPSGQFTYISSGPSITKISPTSGSSFGRTLVTLIGTGFKKVLAVNFGEKPALFYVISDELIEAVSPSGEGKVFVTVITTEGSSENDEAALFTYVNPPASPLDARGCQRVTSCKKRGECAINTLYWTAPKDPSIVRYEIYKDKSLSTLIGIVPSFQPTKFKDPSKIGQKKTYYIVSVNGADVKSSPVKIKVKKFCAEVARESHSSSSSSD